MNSRAPAHPKTSMQKSAARNRWSKRHTNKLGMPGKRRSCPASIVYPQRDPMKLPAHVSNVDSCRSHTEAHTRRACASCRGGLPSGHRAAGVGSDGRPRGPDLSPICRPQWVRSRPNASPNYSGASTFGVGRGNFSRVWRDYGYEPRSCDILGSRRLGKELLMVKHVVHALAVAGSIVITRSVSPARRWLMSRFRGSMRPRAVREC